jgi:hypothetical protein
MVLCPAVLQIRIHMFLGLPDPDLIARGVDPDPALDKKNLDSYDFFTLFGFIFKKLNKCTFKK